MVATPLGAGLMDDDFAWSGPLPAPDFTMVPNLVFDAILPRLDGGEAKVLFYLIRETYGWHHQAVRLSLPDVCRGAGVSRRTAAEALKRFEAVGLVQIERSIGQHGKEANAYRLLVTEDRTYISYTSDRQKVDDLGRIGNSRPSSSTNKQGKKDVDPEAYIKGRYGHRVEP